MAAKTCVSCPWLHANYGSADPQCRRNPPTTQGGWPSVSPTDWCGEHPERNRTAVTLNVSAEAFGDLLSSPEFKQALQRAVVGGGAR